MGEVNGRGKRETVLAELGWEVSQIWEFWEFWEFWELIDLGVGSCVETRLLEKPLLKRVVANAVGVKWKNRRVTSSKWKGTSLRLK